MNRTKLVLSLVATLILWACNTADSPSEPVDHTNPITVVKDTVDSISVTIGTLNAALPTVVQAVWDGGTSASNVDIGGRAVLIIPQKYSGNVTVRVPSDATNYPSLRIMTHDEYSTRDARFVLIPRLFEGIEVPLAGLIRRAYSADPTSPFLTLWSKPYSWTEQYDWIFFVWPSHPIRIAINPDSSVSMTQLDKEFYWRGVEKANRDLRGTYFIAVPFSEARAKVNIRSGGASATTTRKHDFFTGEITECTINMGNYSNLHDSAIRNDTIYFQVIEHELMHCLGVGHTRSWRSAMPSPYLAVPDYSPFPISYTAEDVAMYHLLEAIWNKQHSMGAPFGFAEAYNGWMVLEQNGNALSPSLNGQAFTFFALAALN